MKPPKKIKPLTKRTSKAAKKAAAAAAAARAARQRNWVIGGAVALFVVIAWFLLRPAQQETPSPASSSRPAGTEGKGSLQPPAPAAAPAATMPEKPLAFIQAVRLRPLEPTRLDSLKAEVEVAPDAPGKLTYTYLWEVNDRVVGDAAGDTLNLSTCKKGDLVTVTVTPHDGDIVGFAVESPVVAIQNLPPSLELKTTRLARKIGEPIELQLVGAAPDGNLVAFSLEAPLLPGMTIDKRTGKISWHRQPDQKGTLRFGAAVEDDNRSKVTKIFAVTIE